MRTLSLTAAMLTLLAVASAGRADTLGPGATLPALTLNDQHDEPGTIDASTGIVLYTRDMDASKIAKEALEENGERLLEQAAVAYVAEVSRMPGFVTRFFAVPAMRKRPYRMLLDREGTATAGFPTEESHVTLIYLDALTIERVEHAESAWELRRALRAAAAARAAAQAADTATTSADAPAEGADAQTPADESAE